jgi:hypothetical protein
MALSPHVVSDAAALQSDAIDRGQVKRLVDRAVGVIRNGGSMTKAAQEPAFTKGHTGNLTYVTLHATHAVDVIID